MSQKCEYIFSLPHWYSLLLHPVLSHLYSLYSCIHLCLFYYRFCPHKFQTMIFFTIYPISLFLFLFNYQLQSYYLLYAGKVTGSTFITEEISYSSLSSLFLHTPHTHDVPLFNLTMKISSFQYSNAHFLTKIVERKK